MLLTCIAGAHKIKAFLQPWRAAAQAPESIKLRRKEPEQEPSKQHQKPKNKTKQWLFFSPLDQEGSDSARPVSLTNKNFLDYDPVPSKALESLSHCDDSTSFSNESQSKQYSFKVSGTHLEPLAVNCSESVQRGCRHAATFRELAGWQVLE